MFMKTLFRKDTIHVEKFWFDGNNIFVNINNLLDYTGTLGFMYNKKQWVCFTNPARDEEMVSKLIETVLKEVKEIFTKQGIFEENIVIAQRMTSQKKSKWKRDKEAYGTLPYLKKEIDL